MRHRIRASASVAAFRTAAVLMTVALTLTSACTGSSADDDALRAVDNAQSVDELPNQPVLDESNKWTLAATDEGPTIGYQDLPKAVVDLTGDIPGFDRTEPIVARETVEGFAYKTEDWLFAAECAAVDIAYRTFSDPRYNTACPGTIDQSPIDS